MKNTKKIPYIFLTILLSIAATGCDGNLEHPNQPTSAPLKIPAELFNAPGAGTETAPPPIDKKYIALTFDDGPRADTTEKLLDGLAERNASATFFVIGEQVRGNEYLLCRMATEGHQIGNHTYSHTRLTTVDTEHMTEEIYKSEAVLREVVGDRTFWLRPPYGQMDAKRAEQIKTPMIYWSIDPQDWKLQDADKVTAAVLKGAQSGDIVLLHDFYASSVDAALAIIDALQPEGYAFVTVEELFRIQGESPETGVLYAKPGKARPLR